MLATPPRLVFLVLVIPLGAQTRHAHADGEAVNVGVTENVSLPDGDHLGVYLYGTASLAVPRGPVVLVPSLGVEVAPESGRWGAVAAFAVDVPVSARLGLDVAITVIHDQPGLAWSDALFSGGASAGVSIFLGRHAVSPFVGVYRQLDAAAWSGAVGVNLARAF